jgi:hypothetical protein
MENLILWVTPMKIYPAHKTHKYWEDYTTNIHIIIA